MIGNLRTRSECCADTAEQDDGWKPASTVSLADMKAQLTLLQDNIASAVNALQQVKESARASRT
jgi:hypothetical protein